MTAPRSMAEVIQLASEYLMELSGKKFDLLTITKQISVDSALDMAKVVSKLSPLLGNMIEFNVVEYLGDKPVFKDLGKWRRQDPGFPDAVFESNLIVPTPGFEIKAWFPLATEITARFKDSQNHFSHDNTHVAMIAWLPEHLIYGKPYILDVVIVSGASVARARDNHYHNPPDYLVLEPENTTARTRNLQQTNTNGFKWQGQQSELAEAQRIVDSWGPEGSVYKPTPEYRKLLQQLISKFNYRLDTNYAKMDRIVHPEIEEFKNTVMNMTVNGMTVRQWCRVLSSGDDERIKNALRTHLVL